MTDRDFTVVLKDYGHPSGPPGTGETVVVRARGATPEHAAGEAECGVAIEIWKQRWPELDVLKSAELGMDDEWMACMESVHTLAVIDGLPTVWFEDGIYFPDYEGDFVLKAPEVVN